MIKVETSISEQEINLTSFLEKYINMMDKSFPFSYKMIPILEQLNEHCSFTGLIEKVMNKIIKNKQIEIEKLFQKS